MQMQNRIYLSNKFLNSSFSSSSRPIAKFDKDIETLRLNPQVKHLGVFNHSAVKLPEQLKKAIEKILISCPDASLTQNAEILNNHLIFKKPPLTETKLNEIKVTCTEKVSHPFPGKSI
jgi:hypothetical protein